MAAYLRGLLEFWDVALAGLGAALCLVIVALAWRAMRAWQRRRLERRFTVVVQNLGNARTRLRLWIEDPAGLLAYRFSGPGLTHTAAVAAPVPHVGTNGASAHAAATRRPAAPAAAGLVKAGGAVAQLFSRIAYLLPGQLGAQVRSVERQVSQVHYSVDRVQSVMEDASDTAGAVRGAAAPPPAAPAAPPVAAASAAPARVEAVTGLLAPGETLTLQLAAAPLRAVPAQVYRLTVMSQALEAPGAPTHATLGEVQLRALDPLRRYGPPALLVLTALVGVGAGVGYILWVFGVV